MRTFALVLLLTVAAGVGQAAAAGGMGDSAKWLREQNAICDAQRRGEGPRYPDMCLPEMPPAPVPEVGRGRG